MTLRSLPYLAMIGAVLIALYWGIKLFAGPVGSHLAGGELVRRVSICGRIPTCEGALRLAQLPKQSRMIMRTLRHAAFPPHELSSRIHNWPQRSGCYCHHCGKAGVGSGQVAGTEY
jgi:hypothetical protein